LNSEGTISCLLDLSVSGLNVKKKKQLCLEVEKEVASGSSHLVRVLF